MEKLSKRALGCMYTAAIIGAVLEIIALVAVNMLWFIPENIEIGTTVSIVLGIIFIANALIRKNCLKVPF